jgi:hypothetical protein
MPIALGLSQSSQLDLNKAAVTMQFLKVGTLYLDPGISNIPMTSNLKPLSNLNLLSF